MSATFNLDILTHDESAIIVTRFELLQKNINNVYRTIAKRDEFMAQGNANTHTSRNFNNII